MPFTEAEHLTHAISVLTAVEELYSDPGSQAGIARVHALGGPIVAATSLALLQAVFIHWGQASGRDPMHLLQMVRNEMEVQRAIA